MEEDEDPLERAAGGCLGTPSPDGDTRVEEAPVAAVILEFLETLTPMLTAGSYMAAQAPGKRSTTL